jgi:predicted DNA-binding transcriptional regulator YafY
MTVHKFSRLLLLAATVKTNAEQTPEQLWRSLGVKKAQYHRDKKALEEIDFVFKYDRKQRRFVIDKEPFLPVFDLQLTETFALTMAVRQLSAAGDYLLTYHALAAINKIIANASGPQRELLSESMRESVLREGFGCREPVLRDLQKALHERRRIKIAYQPPPADAPREYEIDPYQMYFKRRALYLDAYCPDTRDYRVFRINRIANVQPTHMQFTRHADYNFVQRHRHSFSVFVGDTVQRVRVRFKKERAPYIREACWHRSQKLTTESDGSLLSEVEVNDPREVGWWVLQWDADAEVLEPESLRQELREAAQKLVGVYAGTGKNEENSQD